MSCSLPFVRITHKPHINAQQTARQMLEEAVACEKDLAVTGRSEVDDAEAIVKERRKALRKGSKRLRRRRPPRAPRKSRTPKLPKPSSTSTAGLANVTGVTLSTVAIRKPTPNGKVIGESRTKRVASGKETRGGISGIAISDVVVTDGDAIASRDGPAEGNDGNVGSVDKVGTRASPPSSPCLLAPLRERGADSSHFTRAISPTSAVGGSTETIASRQREGHERRQGPNVDMDVAAETLTRELPAKPSAGQELQSNDGTGGHRNEFPHVLDANNDSHDIVIADGPEMCSPATPPQSPASNDAATFEEEISADAHDRQDVRLGDGGGCAKAKLNGYLQAVGVTSERICALNATENRDALESILRAAKGNAADAVELFFEWEQAQKVHAVHAGTRPCLSSTLVVHNLTARVFHVGSLTLLLA